MKDKNSLYRQPPPPPPRPPDPHEEVAKKIVDVLAEYGISYWEHAGVLVQVKNILDKQKIQKT